MAELGIEELCARAKRAIAERRFSEGRELYAKAVSVSPDSADVHFGLATCCFLLNELDMALEHFHEVTRLDPMRATPFINMGAIYNRIGQQDKAIACLRKGLNVDPHCAEGHYNLGIAYRQKGMSDLAVQAYREATRLNPKMADAFFNLGNALYDTGHSQEAASAYEQAVQVRPNFKKALFGLKRAQESMAAAKRAESGPPTGADQPASESAARTAQEPAQVAEQAPTGFANEVERAEALEALREACVKQEECCRELGRVIEHDLRPALQDLSHSLVGTPGLGDLELRAMAYAESLEKLREVRQQMVQGMERIRKLGGRFVAATEG